MSSPIPMLSHNKDIIYHFTTRSGEFHGKVVSLDHSLHSILTQHPYPPEIATILGELVVTTTMLGHMLPNGIFTAQMASAGPIQHMIADYEVNGRIRAYAQCNSEEAPHHMPSDGQLTLTMILDGNQPTYQNHIPLSGAPVSELVAHYFQVAEQMDTIIHTSLSKSPDDEWVGRGILIQQQLSKGANDNDAMSDLDLLVRWESLISHCAAHAKEQLSSTHLGLEEILLNILPGEDMWVEQATRIEHKCRCNRASLEEALYKLSTAEKDALTHDGKIRVSCQFCGHTEGFSSI